MIDTLTGKYAGVAFVALSSSLFTAPFVLTALVPNHDLVSVEHTDRVPVETKSEEPVVTEAVRIEAKNGLAQYISDVNSIGKAAYEEEKNTPFGAGRIVHEVGGVQQSPDIYEIYRDDKTFVPASMPLERSLDALLEKVGEDHPDMLSAKGPELLKLLVDVAFSENYGNFLPSEQQRSPLVATFDAATDRICTPPIKALSEAPDCFPASELGQGTPLAADIATIKASRAQGPAFGQQ